jgi:hypothetical protein
MTVFNDHPTIERRTQSVLLAVKVGYVLVKVAAPETLA